MIAKSQNQLSLPHACTVDPVGVGAGLKNHKNIGCLSNTGLDSLKNHKATKPAINVGPSSALKAMMACFRWYLDPLLDPSGSAHGMYLTLTN